MAAGQSSRFYRTFNTLRTHKKKSIVGFGLGAYLLYKAKEHLYERECRRRYFREASVFGTTPLDPTQPAKKLLVILNPGANLGKALDTYRSTVEPMLNLAGLDAKLVKMRPDRADHIEQIVEEETGGKGRETVLIAGGDGTVWETLTAIVRSRGEDETGRRVTFGVLPLGRQNNSIASRLYRGGDGNRIEFVCEAAMAVIRDIKRPLDVMKFTVDGAPQGAYGLVGLHCGATRDMPHIGKEKYWYFGPLRYRVAYLVEAFRDPRRYEVAVETTPVCSGCSKCYTSPRESDDKKARLPSWRSLFVVTRGKPKVKETEDYSGVDNPDCGVWEPQRALRFSELAVTSSTSRVTSWPPRQLDLVVSESMSPWEFVRVGWQRIRRRKLALSVAETPALSDTTVSGYQKVRITPLSGLDWYDIDNEGPFDARRVEIELVKKRFSFFSSFLT